LVNTGDKYVIYPMKYAVSFTYTYKNMDAASSLLSWDSTRNNGSVQVCYVYQKCVDLMIKSKQKNFL